MNRLVKLVDCLINQIGFRFGDIWRPKSSTLCAIIPILREQVAKEPRYYLLSDVVDKVTLLESGNISEIIVKVDESVDKPVFVKGGSMLKGKGTQSRVIRFSVVLIPSRVTRIKKHERKISVLCIAELDPIVPKKTFTYAGSSTPPRLHRDIIRGDQAMLWSKIRSLSSRFRVNISRLTDLMDTVVSRYEVTREALRKMPVYNNQVGVALLDFHGVVAVELFDHPTTWRKLAKDISRGYVEYLTEESELFELKRDVAYKKVKEFIGEVKKCKEYKVHEDEGTATYLLESDRVLGEYTILNDEVIHLFITRREKQKPEITPGITEYPEKKVEEMARKYGEMFHLPRDRRRISLNAIYFHTIIRRLQPLSLRSSRIGYNYKAFDIIEALREKPLTWKELVERVRMAKATLSDRLKKLIEMGYITKILRDDGREAYALTARGHMLIRELKGEASSIL